MGKILDNTIGEEITPVIKSILICIKILQEKKKLIGRRLETFWNQQENLVSLFSMLNLVLSIFWSNKRTVVWTGVLMKRKTAYFAQLFLWLFESFWKYRMLWYNKTTGTISHVGYDFILLGGMKPNKFNDNFVFRYDNLF